MSIIKKLFVFGSIAAGVAYLRKQRALGPLGEDVPPDADFGIPDAEVIEEVVIIATSSGMADVDPESLSQVAGEGIDRDANAAAREELGEQRGRMPGSPRR